MNGYTDGQTKGVRRLQHVFPAHLDLVQPRASPAQPFAPSAASALRKCDSFTRHQQISTNLRRTSAVSSRARAPRKETMTLTKLTSCFLDSVPGTAFQCWEAQLAARTFRRQVTNAKNPESPLAQALHRVDSKGRCPPQAGFQYPGMHLNVK